MASREKRPLAPSKSKQKANHDSGLPSNVIKSKKGRVWPSLKQQQLAHDILEAVATSSQLPAKLEASLPRKKVLKNLKRKQKLRVAKTNFIKAKVTKKVSSRNLRRINTDIKKGVKTKRIKLLTDTSVKIGDNLKILENHIDIESEDKGVDTSVRSAKTNLRTKKTKPVLKVLEDFDTTDFNDKDTDSGVGSSVKNSPKLGRKAARTVEIPDAITKSAKATTKVVGLKRNVDREKEPFKKYLVGADIKYSKGRKQSIKDEAASSNIKLSGVDSKFSRAAFDNKNSIDLTIEEVISSMLSDSEVDNQQAVAEKIDRKVTRSKKMLVGESVTSDIEMKKEPDNEDTRIMSDGECVDGDQGPHFQNSIQLRKRSTHTTSQRSLRNGKLRQPSDSGITTESESKKRRRLNSDDPVISDVSTEHPTDGTADIESCHSASSGDDSHEIVAINKHGQALNKHEIQKNFDENNEINSEVENNNNSERVDRIGEVGPTLRSKTKAKGTTDADARSDSKNDDMKIEDVRIAPRSVETQDELKKVNLDQVRKDSILSKLSDKSKGRRNSLNIDMKKTVHSFYGTEKSDGNPKSQIDQMIENIKLTIAKSIESKIFGPEKGLGLSKNFEVPKIEEIIAPLSTESQKLGLEENTDEEKSSNVSKSEIKSDSSENSVPKVADTAKEIEKLVMGDIELTDTQSQNIQESESSSSMDVTQEIQNNCQATHNPENENESVPNNMIQLESPSQNCSISSESSDKHKENPTDNQITLHDDKKGITTRKSSRIVDKSSPESTVDYENAKKLNKASHKTNQKCNNTEESSLCEADKSESIKGLLDGNTLNNDAFTMDTVHIDKLPREQSDKSVSQVSVIPDAIQATKSCEDQRLVDNMDKFERDLCLNLPLASEESETLESISREVERLVAEGQSNNQLEAPNKDVVNEETNADFNINETLDVKYTDIVNEEKKVVKQSDILSTESFVADIVGVSTSDVSLDEICETTNISSQLAESNELTLTEVYNTTNSIQCVKKLKNSHTLTILSCDSNPDYISTNSVPLDVCTVFKDIDDDKTEGNENCENKEIISHNVLTLSSTSNDSNVNEVPLNKNVGHKEDFPTGIESDKLEKCIGENKSVTERNVRVLRTRDKNKKNEKQQVSRSRERLEIATKIKIEDDVQTTQQLNVQNNIDNIQGLTLGEKVLSENFQGKQPLSDAQNNSEIDLNDSLQSRTRRSREIKKRKEDQQQMQNVLKTKRSKRDIRKSDQHFKEETLLDNEVAKINENNRAFISSLTNATDCTENFRGFSEGSQDRVDKISGSNNNLRSKSENDLTIPTEPVVNSGCDPLHSRNLSENHMESQTENADILNHGNKTIKTLEIVQKDLDETSTSGESSSSVNIDIKILETPEDKAKKESILRLLGLESLEKAAERLNHQKARKEQYTGTLKTVIRVQKEKDKDKKRSRSPLKMVLKQGRGDGEGDTPEFYTIQKEFGTSGLGDSSSGANRKFTTNHRHSCDEDNEEAPPKDRQSLVIPEKSSSFSIHPGRLCADVCCYCFGKFGSLDTPMHLAQMKSDERRKKILNIERHLTKDSCLCDACYRHVDRKANTSPTNMQTKPQKQHRQLMVSKCTARECRDPARHHVKRRWLLKIKAGLQNQVDIDWESSQHTSMSFCVSHYSIIERFLTCALCKRRLARNHTHQLGNVETGELNQRLSLQGIPVLLAAGTFVCKLCRYFTQLQLKYKDIENMNTNHRSFFKSYRKRILHYHDIEVFENDDDDSSNNQGKDKEKRKKSKCTQVKNGNSKSPESILNSASEKSTPEPNKHEGIGSETDHDSSIAKSNASNDNIVNDVQFLGIESTVEKLKKRKLIDMHQYTTENAMPNDGSSEVVEILAMDKEVTLTRLPKRPRTNNDITPVVQRLGANPSISVRTLFPGEEEMNLHANIEFTNVREITPQGWEKCATMIQYDRDTKLLWQELQRPYGNQSSFLRHLILLEKYYRSGDLILAPNASRNAINYSTSVQNRLISYEGPEKMDEPIMEPISTDFNNPRRLSGGYLLERDRFSLPSTSSIKPTTSTIQSTKGSPPRVLKLNPGVSIIKKPPPSLQRLSLPSTSASNGTIKRKDSQKLPVSSGGKVFQLSEPDFKRLQNLKKQKQLLGEKQCMSPSSGSASSNSPPNFKSSTQYQKAQMAAHTQFQKHLRMQQEMLNRQSRGDFEPLICDIRSLANENSPTQNLLHNLNLPKSIQVTTKPPNPIPILPKIPKSLTVIPQTVTRPTDK